MEKQTKPRIALIMSLMLSVIFLWSCGGNNEQKALNEKLQDAKQSATKTLNDLNNDLDERIAYVDEQMETANEEIKDDLMVARGELEEQKAIVNQELKNIEDANLETWDSVVAKTNEVVRNVKSATNEASLRVRNLLNGEE